MLSSVRRPPPQVTGISPKEGIPGTRVTIRGENLGVDARDLIGLRICGVDCLLSAEWKSANKITARTGQAKGKGEIIVCTRSGGVGSSTVVFRGYNIQIGPQQESAVWIDETQVAAVYGRNRASTPMTQDHDDPLGISDESNDKRFSEEKLLDMFPEGSGNTALENFEPAWFLLENHHCTGFDDLKAGLAHLKRKSSTRSEGPREFVKTNLTTFLDCYDTLTEMHAKIAADQSDMLEGSVTQPLEEVLKKSNEAAVGLFYGVLARKDRADATRNALGVLQRFKFLFNLPCTMEKNIKKGDFDLVITDYTRAKSLFGDSDVQLFRKVYEEVEKRIKEFREMLYKKLLDLPSTVDDQKKIIRYLGHLDMPGDAAWECLLNMQKWQLNLLNVCKENHIAKDIERQKEAAVSAATASSPLSPSLTIPSRQHGQLKNPQRILFVEELTKILTDNMPDVWRLGQAYFSGKLLKEVKNATKINSNKRAHFNGMVQGVVDVFSKLVRAAFLPRTLKHGEAQKYGLWKENKKESPSAWLPTCVRYTRACALSLASLELPNDTMEILQQLAFDMRANCMTLLLKQAIENIKNLHNRETWAVDRDDERGGTTLLPALFENLVTESLQQLQEVIHAKQGETELFKEKEIESEAMEMCVQLLQSFAVTAEQLALLGNMEENTKGRGSVIRASEQSEEMPCYERRLIIMMSNCAHTKKHILPRLVENLEKHDYPETSKVQAAAAWCYQSLDERLFDKYIEEKANPISGVLEQNMYAGMFDWKNCSKPTGVRTYVKEALMGIIQVHKEVYSFCPSFVSRVMYHLIEYVMNEISRLFQCVPDFCNNGAIQARLEIYALDAALGYYKTDETISALKEALNCIPEIEKEDEKYIHGLLHRFKTHHKFLLTCFQPDKRIRNSQYY